jgi:hypothetical protein
LTGKQTPPLGANGCAALLVIVLGGLARMGWLFTIAGWPLWLLTGALAVAAAQLIHSSTLC